MKGDVEVVVATNGSGRPIAGAFNFSGANTLYGRYCGATEEHPFLHFNVCYYHSIEQCVERKIARVEPGAGGEDKRVRGVLPTLTFSVHHVDGSRRLAGRVE